MAAGRTYPANKLCRPPPSMQTRGPYPILAADAFARDGTVAWLRGEFAAANAIIDALCGHLEELASGGAGRSDYGPVFAAIHQRRLNWIPVLQLQEFYSIAEVVMELKRVAARRAAGVEEEEPVEVDGQSVGIEEVKGSGRSSDSEIVDVEHDSPATATDATDSGPSSVSFVGHNIKLHAVDKKYSTTTK